MQIGVDLGGTNIRAGLNNDGKIIARESKKLEGKESLESTLVQLKSLIKSLITPAVKGIGVGVPSVVDTRKGIVYNVTNIPSWTEVPLKDILEKEFNLPVCINNDANCFVLGEQCYGLAKGYKHVVGLTIGTGVGAGLVLNNQLYEGHNCGAGEVGTLPYLDQNMEYYCSGNFFSTFHNISGLEVFEKAQKGNEKALKLWEEYGFHFGQLMQAVLYAYDPEAVVLGGSVAAGYPFFKEAMYKGMQSFFYPESVKRLQIFQSQNKDISLLGAAALVK